MCIMHIKLILRHKSYLALVDYNYIICIECREYADKLTKKSVYFINKENILLGDFDNYFQKFLKISFLLYLF